MMNRAEFIDGLAKRLGSDRFSATTALDAILDEIYVIVENGEKLTLHGFGSFAATRRLREPRVFVPTFRAGAEFKRIVADGEPIELSKPIKNGRQPSTPADRQLPDELPTTEITVKAAQRKIRRIERKLVKDYEAWHGGKLVPKAWTIDSTGERIECDIFDVSRNEIVEAKAGATRRYVRMALGQLLDYRRHEPTHPNIAMLLPELPNKDLQRLVAEHGVTIIHRAGKGFDCREPAVRT
jgi:nucleoid DNA-binding protein